MDFMRDLGIELKQLDEKLTAIQISLQEEHDMIEREKAYMEHAFSRSHVSELTDTRPQKSHFS